MTRALQVGSQALMLALVGTTPLPGCTESSRIPGDSPGGVAGAGSEPMNVSGPLVYLNSELTWLADDEHAMRFAARITGISSIDILSGDSEGFHTSRATSPGLRDRRCSPAFPVAIARLALPSESERVLVSDACGNWIVSSGESPDSHDWISLLPELPTTPYLQVVGDSTILASDGSSLITLDVGQRGSALQPRQQTLPPPFLKQPVSTASILMPATKDHAESLLIQLHRQFARFDLDALRTGDARATPLSQQLTPPFVLPYSAFDQLAVWPDARCSSEAVGIGLFDDGVRFVRRFNLLMFNADQYSVSDLDHGDATCIALAVTAGPTPDSFVFALVQHASQTRVQLWRRSDCGPIEKISEAPIDFDWRSALQTVDGTTQPIPRSPGVSLLAKWLSRSEELVAVHYDGFAVRLFIAKASDGWRLSERIIEVNRTRDDYAFVE